MLWMAVVGEISLVLALGLCVQRAWRLRDNGAQQKAQAAWPYQLLAVACSFIACNAAVGALRYAGFTDIVPLHRLLTGVSVAWMMPLYVGAALWLWGWLSARLWCGWLGVTLLPTLWAMLLSGLAAVSVDVTTWPAVPKLLTDAMLVFGLLRIIQQATNPTALKLALAALLAVPLSGLLPLGEDAGLGLFHLLLALHFFAFYRAIPDLERQTCDRA